MSDSESITNPQAIVSCACGCGATFTAVRPDGYRRRYVHGHNPRGGRPLAERFWAKVNKDGPVHPVLGTACWLWTGATTNFGHGCINDQGVTRTTHRLAWILIVGPIPEGLCALHRCDVPNCVRASVDPQESHLFLGTKLDNARDCISKGRDDRSYNLRGERHANSKLTDAAVIEIRELYRSGLHQRDIAAKFGVSKTQVGSVLRGKAWRHV